MISNIVIIDKNEKLCQSTAKPGTQGAFSGEVTSDSGVFTDETGVQCDVQVVGNNFIDNIKKNDTNDK